MCLNPLPLRGMHGKAPEHRGNSTKKSSGETGVHRVPMRCCTGTLQNRNRREPAGLEP